MASNTKPRATARVKRKTSSGTLSTLGVPDGALNRYIKIRKLP
jgi:hypothetical protein